jgi:hypothetical protein
VNSSIVFDQGDNRSGSFYGQPMMDHRGSSYSLVGVQPPAMDRTSSYGFNRAPVVHHRLTVEGAGSVVTAIERPRIAVKRPGVPAVVRTGITLWRELCFLCRLASQVQP